LIVGWSGNGEFEYVLVNVFFAPLLEERRKRDESDR
jgi:hypothetical protein